MKISTQIDTAAHILGDERAIEEYAKVGFDAWDFSMFSMVKYNPETGFAQDGDHPLGKPNYLAFARKLKEVGLDNGIICNQSHAPFNARCKNLHSYLLRAIECTAEAGGSICVIHPVNQNSAEENAEMYQKLLPFAKDCGVKIATENMYNWDLKEEHATFAACSTPKDFNAHLDAVNDSSFVACLDIGHAELFGLNTSAVEMIEALGNRLQALHIHDVDLRHDLHQIPFSQKINWEKVVKALKKVNYSGYFTLEVDNYLKTFDKTNILGGMKDLSVAARKLADMFEAC